MPTTRSLNTVSAWIRFHSDQGPHLYDPAWRSWMGWGILSFASAAVSGPSGWELCPQGTGAGAAPSIKGSSAGRTGASIRLSTEGSIWGFSRGTGRVTPASCGTQAQSLSLPLSPHPQVGGGNRGSKGPSSLDLCWFSWIPQLPTLPRQSWSYRIPGTCPASAPSVGVSLCLICFQIVATALEPEERSI